MNLTNSEERFLKASYWKALLMFENNDCDGAIEIMKDILPGLKRHKMLKKAEMLESLI